MNRNLILLILLFLANVSFCQTISKKENDSLKQETVKLFRQIYWNALPKQKGWVNDYERIFSDDEERKLDSIISKYEKETTVEIAIVTIDTIKVEKDKFEALSLHIAKAWGVGKKGKDNGVLIGVSKGYRKIRIELGNGISKVISDQDAKGIIENDFIPEFKKGNYYQGMVNGITRLMDYLRVRLKEE